MNPSSDPVSIDTGTDQLLCEIRDGVALITLNRPDARNALSDQLSPALRRMIRACGDDTRVGALLLTGAGTAFCAGGDVKGMGDASSKKDWSDEARISDLIERERPMIERPGQSMPPQRIGEEKSGDDRQRRPHRPPGKHEQNGDRRDADRQVERLQKP